MPGPPAGDPERVPRPGARRRARSLSPRLLVIAGPTGTGKSELAVELAVRLDGEIVGCDALQVYRGLDAATAKPSRAARERVPHHLIDVADPRRDFSLADYVRLAERAIEEIRARRRVPLVVGGTGLYLRGLLRGIVEAPPRDPALRDRLRRLAERHGSARLHRWLRRVDPASAERLPPADTQRILRALEIALRGEETWSATLRAAGTWHDGHDRYPALKIGLDMDRERLALRLAERVERFFADGLVEELRALLAAGVPREANAFKAIGYREVLARLDDEPDAAEVVERVVRNTRRYAKRQRTWFRKEPGIAWLDVTAGPAAAVDDVLRSWHAGTS